jgi:glycosyltransferase involved in cell wall biosynthesis
MPEDVFCIVDPCLKDMEGHHFEYDRSVAEAARRRGYEVLVLGHRQVEAAIDVRLDVRKTFRRDIWESFTSLALLPGRLNLWRTNRSFYDDLCRGLSGTELTPGSVVFGHMITSRQLLGWAWWCRRLPAATAPQVVLLLRYQAAFYRDGVSMEAFRLLELAARNRPIRLATDSARLARHYRRLTTLPIEVLPIPHTVEAAPAPPGRGPGRPLRLVSLGNARDEKGILEILQAIRLLEKKRVAGSLEFVLQCNHPWPDAVARAIDQFASACPANVRLIREVLDSDAYYRELSLADVVLAPYWRSIYDARTSGVFLEAWAAGKPVITTDNTWMSDQLQGSGAGIACPDRNPAALARAIADIQRDYDTYARRAAAASATCRQWHNPDSLVALLAGPPARESRPAGWRRAAVLYPWGDALLRESGAAIRVGLLIDFLQTQFDEVRVLQVGNAADREIKNVSFEFLSLPQPLTLWSKWSRWKAWITSAIGRRHNWRRGLRQRLDRLAGAVGLDRWFPPVERAATALCRLILRIPGLRACLRPCKRAAAGLAGKLRLAAGCRTLVQTGKRSVILLAKGLLWLLIQLRSLSPIHKILHLVAAESFMLRQHWRYRHNRPFQSQVDNLAGWADVVFLEYTFGALSVAEACRRHGSRLVVTDYDVVADQSARVGLLRRLTLNEELAGLRAADHAVCVSPKDQQAFRTAGVTTECIPNPIDFFRLQPSMPEPTTRRLLLDRCGLDLSHSKICLFVGSAFGPNYAAVAALRRMAAALAATPQGDRIVLVVAGGCARPQREDNFVALGRVEHSVLWALYQSASLVLIPIQAGTGMAVKTIEAMAMGKAILGTRIGFRGYAVASGTDCLICDDLDQYPQRIRQLLEDDAQRRHLAANARSFAESYDYRRLFAHYLELLALPSRPAAGFQLITSSAAAATTGQPRPLGHPSQPI